MKKQIAFETLQRVSARLGNELVNCEKCCLCCSTGPLWVLEEEIPILIDSAVPLANFEGIWFIRRDKGGICPLLDKNLFRCKIYEKRPVCCRLYPLDLFNRSGKLEWGIYTVCPVEHVLADKEQRYHPQGACDGEILRMAQMIEAYFGDKRLAYLAREDRISAEIELLETLRYHYRILGQVRNQPKEIELNNVLR